MADRDVGSSAQNDEEKVVHEYDGIQECDNRLPLWWLYTLFGTIVFSIGYFFHYEVFKSGEQPTDTYARELAMEQAAAAERVKALGVIDDNAIVTLAKDANTVKKGKDVFASTCAACHGENGGGTIGPNLTDKFWLHGANPEAVYRTIQAGVPAKGMPAWGAQLGEERVQAVAAYLVTIRNTDVQNGKAPQGDPASD
jgi:cytochrome c oxidase cbb3-type subunit 3